MRAARDDVQAACELNVLPQPDWFVYYNELVLSQEDEGSGLAVVIVIAILTMLIGTTFGLLAGYYEGWWERVIMRLCDVLLAFPGILLAIGIVAILGGGMVNVIIAVAIFSGACIGGNA